MFVAVFCLHLLVQVLSEAPPPPPPPPQDVLINKWLLTWAPPPEEAGLTYTVQYSFRDKWRNVASCVRTPSTSCDVSAVGNEAEHGCVTLRVHAERRGLESDPVQVCSRHGASCTPEFRLTVRPGSLTVHLNKKHNLTDDYADHAKYRVYYAKEGDSLQETFIDDVSSVSVPGLQEGQRYCAAVQFLHQDRALGTPSCPRCTLVPRSESPAAVIVPAAAALVLILVAVAIAYLLIFHLGKLKRWLRNNRYQIPEHFMLDDTHCSATSSSPPAASPGEEHFSVITGLDRRDAA
ncbi:uncharacterized protein V6R79_003420 [Siganus canaliculatus]